MEQPDPSLIFNEAHAAVYDERFAKLAPLREALDLLMGAVFSDQPEEAHALCVGVGTGSELIALARRFPRWRFTGVEPSKPMLDVCRQRIEAEDLRERCDLHHGYIESIPVGEQFHAATAILVSHFILSAEARAQFFAAIATRLLPNGCLVSADLASDSDSPADRDLMNLWLRMMKGADVSPEEINKLHEAYSRDVSLWPPAKIRETLEANGFTLPVPFFQAGLIHACYAKRR